MTTNTARKALDLIAAQDKLLACYRLSRQPSNGVLNTLAQRAEVVQELEIACGEPVKVLRAHDLANAREVARLVAENAKLQDTIDDQELLLREADHIIGVS